MINVQPYLDKLKALKVWMEVNIDMEVPFTDFPFDDFYCYWWGSYIIEETNPQSFAELAKDFKV